MSAAGQLRILHTADVHLSDDLDPEARFAGWRAFLGQAGRADLLIVAGDLFDHGRVPQSLLDQVVEDLAATPVPVVILPGNHDLAGPGSVQERFDVTRAGPHVISLDAPGGSTAEVPGLDVTVWGRGMTDHTPANNPLAGHAAPGRGRWHIAVAHGHFHRQAPARAGPRRWPRPTSPLWSATTWPSVTGTGTSRSPSPASRAAIPARRPAGTSARPRPRTSSPWAAPPTPSSTAFPSSDRTRERARGGYWLGATGPM